MTTLSSSLIACEHLTSSRMIAHSVHLHPCGVLYFPFKLRPNYPLKSMWKASEAPYSLEVNWASCPASSDVVEGTLEPNGTHCYRSSSDSAPRCADWCRPTLAHPLLLFSPRPAWFAIYGVNAFSLFRPSSAPPYPIGQILPLRVHSQIRCCENILLGRIAVGIA